MFKLLLSINGVGAKAALSILSISRVNNLKYAIVSEDEKLIMKAPGIGKKTAGRIILELKDKLKKEGIITSNKAIDGHEISDDNVTNVNISEAFGALIALGYSEKEAETALKKVNKDDSIENIIKACLKVLMG